MTRIPHCGHSRARLVLALAISLATTALGSAIAQEATDDPALEKYFRANGAYNRNLHSVAIPLYEEFLAEHGDHPKTDLAKRGLALSLYALKQYERAIPPLSELLGKEELDPSISRERLVMLKGQSLLATGKRDEAKTFLVGELDSIKQAGYRAGVVATACDISFSNGKWDEVQTWSTKLLAEKPNPEQSARALYQQGYAHYQSGNADAAIASLGRIADLGAGASWKTRTDYLLGECHNQRQDYAKAEAAFLAALPGLAENDALECRYRLGLTRFMLGKHAEASKDLTAFVGSAGEDSRASEAKLYLARCQLELEDYAKAEPALVALAKGDGDTAAGASLWLARVHTRRDKDYDKAAGVLTAATSRYKGSEIANDLRFDAANALMAKNEPDWKAALALLEPLKSGGGFAQMAEVLSQAAVCQHKLGDYESSLANNQAFLAAHANHRLAADSRFMLAENLFLLNRLDEAAKAYAEFTGKHGDHPQAQAAGFRLAQIYHDQERWDDCLRIAGPMLAEAPEGELFEPLPFLIGDCLFRKDQWAEAAKALGQFVAPRVKTVRGEAPVIAAEPNVDTALMQLAVAHDRLGQAEQSQRYLALLTAYPGESAQLPLALAERGRLAFEAGDLKLARSSLERFLAEDAKESEQFGKGAKEQRPRVMYYLGWVDASEEDYKSSAKRFAEVLRLDPKHSLAPDAALQLGVAWVEGGDFETAARHFADTLRRYPKHPKLARLIYYTGLSLARQKRWNDAKPHFKRVADAHADSEFADQALYEWAWCERRTDRKAEATKLYERLLASHSRSPLAIKVESELAELNLEGGEMEKVIARLTENLAKVKDEKLREGIRYQLATAYFKKGEHEAAAKQFESMLADYPESDLIASILFQAGESRFKLGETVSARDHFSKAAVAKGAPANLAESIAMRLAESQALTGQHSEAQSSYRLFLEQFSESRWIRNAQFGLAFAIENGGDSQGAIPEYRKLLADRKNVDVWTVRSHFQIGECLFNLQKYDEAVSEFLNIELNYRKYPSWQAKSVLEIGRVLIAQDKKEQAADRLKDLIRRYPEEKAATVAQQLLDQLRAG